MNKAIKQLLEGTGAKKTPAGDKKKSATIPAIPQIGSVTGR